MKTRNLIAVAVLLAVGGILIAQQPVVTPPGSVPNLPPINPAASWWLRAWESPVPGGYPPAVPPTGGSISGNYKNVFALPPAPSPASVEPKAETKPDDMTIDQLLEAVKKCRGQKAELEEKEEKLLKTLIRKAAKQKEQIDSLIGPPKATANPDTTRIPSINLPFPDHQYVPSSRP